MRRKVFFGQIFLAILLLVSCKLIEDKSCLRAVNSSFDTKYEDVITNIYICEGATDDNYVSIWNGKLYPGKSVKIDVEPEKYGIKITGTRYYNTGITQPISKTTGYKAPVNFRDGYTIRVTYDGNGIFATEEND